MRKTILLFREGFRSLRGYRLARSEGEQVRRSLTARQVADVRLIAPRYREAIEPPWLS